MKYLVIALLFSSSLYAIPLTLSSKASQLIEKTNEAISQGDRESLKKTTENLEQLVQNYAFLRIDLETQLQAILALSKSYMRLHRFHDQEKLLTEHVGRRTISKYKAFLQAELALSYIEQDRFHEADKLLLNMTSTSCSDLSPEEKNALARVLTLHENTLFSLLKNGDLSFEKGKLHEAIRLYLIVLSSIDRHAFPSQSSSLERDRLRQKITLKLSEGYYLLGLFDKALETLSDWDDSYFIHSECEYIPKKLFLEALILKKKGSPNAKDAFLAYIKTPFEKKPLLDKEARFFLENEPVNTSLCTISEKLFLAQEAILSHDKALLQTAIDSLQKEKQQGITSILTGFREAMSENSEKAFQLLKKGIPLYQGPPIWKEAATSLLLELGWRQAVLAYLSKNVSFSQKLSLELLHLASFSHNSNLTLRKATFNLLLHEITEDPSYKEASLTLLSSLEKTSSLAESPLYIAYRKLFDNTPINTVESLTLSDQLFLMTISQVIDQKEESFHEFSHASDVPTYLEAIASYEKAIHNEESLEKAEELMNRCLIPALEAARPQVLHCLIDIQLRKNQSSSAYQILLTLLKEFPDYPDLSHAILSTILSFEKEHDHEEDRLFLCQKLLEKPYDISSLALSFHLFHNNLIIPSSSPLDNVFSLLKEEKTALLDAGKSQEPGVVKEKLEEAIQLFEKTKVALIAMKEKVSTHNEFSYFLWSLLFFTHSELIETLENNLVSSFAYNELPTRIEHEGSSLQEEINQFLEENPSWQSSIHPHLILHSQLLVKTCSIFATTFKNELQEAYSIAEEISSEDPSSFSPLIRAYLFLATKLRENTKPKEALLLLEKLDESLVKETDHVLLLEIAIQKSLCLKDLNEITKAMKKLALVINDSYASSLRVKAMILRADLYLMKKRKDLAIRQLNAVVKKGGEWSNVAERKLQELYGNQIPENQLNGN